MYACPMHFLLVLLLGKRYSRVIHGLGGRKEEALKRASAFLCSRNLYGGSGKSNKILPTFYHLLIFWVPTTPTSVGKKPLK